MRPRNIGKSPAYSVIHVTEEICIGPGYIIDTDTIQHQHLHIYEEIVLVICAKNPEDDSTKFTFLSLPRNRIDGLSVTRTNRESEIRRMRR